MNSKGLKKTLAKHLENRDYVTVSRGIKNDTFSDSSGYIIAFSDHFVMIADITEFRFSGFHCIPLATITEIRRNKNDEYYGMIFEKERSKELKQFYKKKNQINISSFETIAINLKDNNECVIVECECEKHDYFSIGYIQKVTSKNITINYFNAQGILEEPIKEKIKEITKITYRDNYSNTFKKYIKS